MPLNLLNKSFTQLFIDGVEFPITALPMRQITMNSNVKQHLPVLEMHLDADYDTFSSSIPLNDGTQLQLLMHDNINSGATSTITLKAYGTPQRKPSIYNKGLSTYSILGLLDKLPFILSNPSQAFAGTSHDVMTAAAKQLGFTLNSNVVANDLMNWLPGRKTWANFLQHTVAHAYADASSAITMAVDEFSNLHFHNLADLFANTKPVAYIFFGAMKDTSFTRNYLATDHQARNLSGMHNNIAAYGLRTQQVGLDGVSLLYNAVKATTSNNSLDIASKVLNEVSSVAKLRFAPVFTGSTHDNWINARHQK